MATYDLGHIEPYPSKVIRIIAFCIKVVVDSISVEKEKALIEKMLT